MKASCSRTSSHEHWHPDTNELLKELISEGFRTTLVTSSKTSGILSIQVNDPFRRRSCAKPQLDTAAFEGHGSRPPESKSLTARPRRASGGHSPTVQNRLCRGSGFPLESHRSSSAIVSLQYGRATSGHCVIAGFQRRPTALGSVNPSELFPSTRTSFYIRPSLLHTNTHV